MNTIKLDTTTYTTPTILLRMSNKHKDALIDLKDYPKICNYTWSLSKAGFPTAKVAGKVTKLHQIIKPRHNAHSIDHINHSRLDNRKANLRKASAAQNSRNRVKCTWPTSSRFKGVCWKKASNKWVAYITYNRRKIWLGSYDDEIKASKEYDRAAKRLHKSFANLNELN